MSRFLDRLESALAKGDADELRAIVNEDATYLGNRPGVGVLTDSGTFDGALGFMQDARLWGLPEAFKFVMIWQHEWGTLTIQQRAELLEVLEAAVLRFADPTSRFLILEVIGDYYSFEEAFPVLERLARSIDGVRQFVPGALRHLFARADSMGRARIEACLSALALDPVPEVRTEAGKTYAQLFDLEV